MNNDNIFYHYCSLDTLHKIIEGKTIRLSNIDRMNDSNEGKDIEKFAKDIIDTMPESLREQYYNQRIYISCFSKGKDILSQWRAYGDDGKGVAIGFDLSELQIPKIILNADYQLALTHMLGSAEVIYTSTEKRETINGINTTPRRRAVNQNGVKVMSTGSINEFSEVLKLKPIFKDEYFIEEKEVRLIYYCMDSDFIKDKNPPLNYAAGSNYDYKLNNKFKYIVKNNQVVDYIELNIAKENENISNKLIKEIVLGPKSSIDTDDYILRKFLEDNGLREIIISKSQGSYR
ncbi:Protein of uncharacterised function (DUF2971) [uncultured Clostridium sp.]|uniref:DUF2971 domain-containing protein n=1 Tax=uncultured Clostridium sp. TaxID=59620 RepID=UPI0008221CDE|nr:DUF2971 domain-containing protein [uncultured Clostridium sp.]SCJ52561.1 Protein of uncharacterised function (DUF2971) [uncultured Clostridium sp.]